MVELMFTLYPWIKAFHIAAVIAWMAGMFYLPRLFVYHAERSVPGDQLDQTFQLMERKLLKLIMNPAMIATWIAGFFLLATPGLIDWSRLWIWVKIASVIGMTICHAWLSRQRKAFAAGENKHSGRTYRMANEIPTVLMLVIVIAVVVRPF